MANVSDNYSQIASSLSYGNRRNSDISIITGSYINEYDLEMSTEPTRTSTMTTGTYLTQYDLHIYHLDATTDSVDA